MKNTAKVWDLQLVATSAAVPKRVVDSLAGAVTACRGWVLAHSEISPRCADIEFEFAREHAVDVYALLIGVGIELSAEAHHDLTSLCQCTRHAGRHAEGQPVRIFLTLYAADGGEEFLTEQRWGVQQAA